MIHPERYLVTSALPYANGPVHIGHLAGVYIPSDIFVRFLRLTRKDVVWVCGSDEHGVPITLKALKEGISPQQVVDKYHGIIKKSFEEFGISFDIYSRTSNKTHYETASQFFKTLYDNNKFIEKTTEQYFDPEANRFLADRYITGTCPHCGNENAYGDQCEKCGTTLNATDLINPKSTISGAQPVMKATKHWYLPLDKNEAFLRQWILDEHKEWKSNVYGQCKSWIDAGLQARAVSRDLEWGVPVPVENADGKVLYVWFDAPIGYISATKELTPDWEKYWKDKNTKLIHFIGKDNIVFHCIIFPAMLKEEGSYILPDNVPANEFLNLEGNKISTSRNWAVWLHEYLIDFPQMQDVLRYVLTANAPETKDNDFTWKDFQTRNNSELVAIYGNFINRALVLTHKFYNGTVPAAGELNETDKAVFVEISKLRGLIEENILNYRFRDALKEFMNMARTGNKYLAELEPWKLVKTDPKRTETIMYTALQITASLAAAGMPFMPFTSEKIYGFLNIKPLDWTEIGNSNVLPAGHQIKEAELLFSKIEDSQIEYQIQKLSISKSKKENEAANMKTELQKDEISFEEFQKMDIRIGTITAAEKVPKTKKLLKLTIDTGIDTRTVVSGIAEYYEPELIIGQQVSILVNLAPRNIKGIESHGMILMAENSNGILAFVQPDKKTENGAGVK
jgi:methionyl-tRNA synthetase